MYDIKALYEAESVEDAVRLLQEHPEAQIIAGGSDVLVQIREGKRAGAELVSIYGIDAMRGVTLDEEGAIRIGSLTSFSHIAASPIIREFIPVLGEAVSLVGGPQIRNIGTIGGNTCNGVTSADSASTLVAWDAVVELTGPEGVRRVPLPEFYIKAGKVDLRPGEIQTAILIPKADARSDRRGQGEGQGSFRGNDQSLCGSRPRGYPSPGQLARGQSLPRTHSGRNGQTRPDKIH